MTTFVGRSAVVESLERAIEHNRCVTILGAGGAGKTRLSLEIARAIAHRFADGSYFVDLSTLARESDVADAVVHVLELPSELASAGARGVERYLRNRRALLILDNCEHVREACAKLAGGLLKAAPRVTILATSRVALGIRAETVYRLAPLSQAEARALFVERAAGAGVAPVRTPADFEHVDRICGALDRSPLAIELAAGLAAHMGLADIERRLPDRFAMLRASDPSMPERHRTLEAAIAWSFELLSDAERRLFERLAVFPASFTFDAALAIGGESPRVLLGLVEKSMVQRDETDAERYRLLFSLAEFAQRRFAGDAANDVRARHARYFSELALLPEQAGYHREQARWIKDVEHELDNVRAALRHLLAASDDDARLGVRMVLALQPFFTARGYLAEGAGWCEAARARTPPGSREYAVLRWRTAKILMRMRKFREAHDAASEAVAFFRRSSSPRCLAEALTDLGAVSISLRDLDAASRLLEEALALSQGEDSIATKAVILANLGVIATASGDDARAIVSWTESARLSKRAGDRRFLAMTLDDLAGLQFIAGNHHAAIGILDEALGIARSLADVTLVAAVTCDMGDVFLAAGRVAEAKDRFSEALAAAAPLGLAYTTSQALMGLAGVAAATGNAAVAARLVGAASAAAEASITTPVNDSLYQRTRKAAVERLGEPEFERERHLGELLEFEDALALAGSVNGFSAVR